MKYTHLIVGETYSIQGALIGKATHTPVLGADGKPVTATASLTVPGTQTDVAQYASGSIALAFDVPATAQCTQIVVFETILNKDQTVVAEHKDTNSPDQTVAVPAAKTLAHDAIDGDSMINEKAGLVDTIT